MNLIINTIHSSFLPYLVIIFVSLAYKAFNTKQLKSIFKPFLLLVLIPILIHGASYLLSGGVEKGWSYFFLIGIILYLLSFYFYSKRLKNLTIFFVTIVFIGYGYIAYITYIFSGKENGKKIVILQFNGINYNLNDLKRLDGTFIKKYNTGEIKWIGEIKNGLRNGKRTIFFKNGNKEAILEFKNSKPHGNVIGWHKNGQLFLKGHYINGEYDGEIIRWYENGKMEKKVNFKQGKLNGQFFKWNTDGELEINAIYKNGKMISYKQNQIQGNIK